MCEALKELFAESFKEDIENARKQGEKSGLQNGLQTGLQNGLRTKAKEVALNLSRMGMAIDDIAEAVGMQVSVVQEWLQTA